MPIGVRDIFVVNLIIKVIFPYLRNSQQVFFHQVPVDVLSAGHRSVEQTLGQVQEYQKSGLVSSVWIQPLYVTYEYITRSREELGKYLDQGKILLMDCQKNKNVL